VRDDGLGGKQTVPLTATRVPQSTRCSAAENGRLAEKKAAPGKRDGASLSRPHPFVRWGTSRSITQRSTSAVQGIGGHTDPQPTQRGLFSPVTDAVANRPASLVKLDHRLPVGLAVGCHERRLHGCPFVWSHAHVIHRRDPIQDRLSQRNRSLSGQRHMRAQSMFRAVPVDCTAAPYTGRGPARPTPFFITHRWLAVMPFLGASQWTSP